MKYPKPGSLCCFKTNWWKCWDAVGKIPNKNIPFILLSIKDIPTKRGLLYLVNVEILYNGKLVKFLTTKFDLSSIIEFSEFKNSLSEV